MEIIKQAQVRLKRRTRPEDESKSTEIAEYIAERGSGKPWEPVVRSYW